MKDNTVYLKHIIDAIVTIEEYSNGFDYDSFLENRLVQDAIIRQFMIIGEASKNLTKDFKEKYPDIPWKQITGMRDKVVHGYFEVDLDAIWTTIEEDLIILKEKLNSIQL